MVAHAAGQREAMLEAALAEVVEEDSTDAARLAAVAKKEILVAPALVAGMIVGAERSQRIAAAAVKVGRVFFEAVIVVAVVAGVIAATSIPLGVR